MAYWLMKSEPDSYAWPQLVKDKRTWWSGVRNHQANNNMKAMRKGDRAFFYHSNDGLAIVGIMEIIGKWKLDPSDEAGKFGMVEVKPVKPVTPPVTLQSIKADEALYGMALLRQSRLSVSAVTEEEWEWLNRSKNQP